MKKAFCFDYFSMSQSKSKFFHVWFEFFPSYLSRKKEISETFLGLGLRPRPQKTFPRFPFFYFGNLGKTQIRRGKILLQTWHGKKSKQNTIASLFIFSMLFVKGLDLSNLKIWGLWAKGFKVTSCQSWRSQEKVCRPAPAPLEPVGQDSWSPRVESFSKFDGW